ncbi:hypothetical protein JMN32_10340 [Fulvivirga sp. 29W222]|uniref:Uncharacterized protein n=1 Tax=Fulvivirga marina TaxID=2494733 RepID=A0A937FXS2_9BACT|nr:hypothetical protein [Fulvivirga marina]MBL6446712.1 hypothetical protein [Fulvivirga marina]
MERILLSTYLLKIRDNSSNDQILSHFNGTDDFIDFFDNFLNHIYENIGAVSEASDNSTKHLTLDTPHSLNRNDRTAYGFFSSGISGDQYKIKDVQTQNELLSVERNHAAYRDIFFYVSMPRNRDSAALVLQRKSKFGIKGLLDKSLNRYLKERGYQIYKVHVNNILHGQVYRHMMTNGKLNKVDLIKRRIPASIEQYYQNGGNLNQIPGTLKTSMMSPKGLPQTFKEFVDRLFTNPRRERIEIAGIDDEFDEVEFELELDGKKKSFYVAQRHKIQPDIDVTNDLEFENGQPTTASLLAQSIELVRDIININPNHVVQN